jgi:homoserine dehydrogenase
VTSSNYGGDVAGDATVRIGLLGCGNVGGALVQLVAENADAVAARTGLRLEVGRVVVRDLARYAALGLPAGVLSDDAAGLATDPSIDIVVEVIGGIEPARRLILAALEAGKPVVTANKELVAAAGAELFDAAAKAGVDLLFEAAVAGAIPLMRPLRESLAGDRLARVIGIVNGTTNFILTRMAEGGQSFGDALAEAQALGYAESDPTADVEGFDAVAKAAIIASVAFGVQVGPGDVHREGIAGVTADDIAMAARLGYVVKLVAVAEKVGDAVAIRVHPAMVPNAHPLAAVRESFNAVFVEGTAAGELMFYGRGAGGRPTASAVLGDVIDAAANLRQGTWAGMAGLVRAPIRPMDELESQYYLVLDVVDVPGVLEKVAGAFARHGVSIEQVVQLGLGEEARLVLITHIARERDVQATLADLRHLDEVDRVGTLLRVVGAEASR